VDGWTAARRVLFVVLPGLGVAAPAINCSLLPLGLALACATGLLVLLRIGFEPWYSDAPLAGYARWVTGVFTGLVCAVGVTIGTLVVDAVVC
jgi:hypothetical protein